MKNRSNQNYQNYAINECIVEAQNPIKGIIVNLNWKQFLGVLKKSFQIFTVYNRNVFVVHPNQRVDTNLNWDEILRSN